MVFSFIFRFVDLSIFTHSDILQNRKEVRMMEKRKEKAKRMRELIDLYEQVKNVKPKSSRLIVEDYISVKEKELVELLKEEEKDD